MARAASKRFLEALSASAKEPKWDIRTERIAATPINTKTGKVSKEEIVTRVQYRKFGSKGRFQSFVVMKKMPRDHQRLVDAYEAEVEKQKLASLEGIKKARTKMTEKRRTST